MLTVIAAVVVVAVVVLGSEVLLARRGERLDEFDVSALTSSFGPPSDAAAHVLWLGDSTAAGVGASSPDHAVSSGVGRRLAERNQISVDVRVVAKSGAVVGDVVHHQVALVRDPDVVVVSIGANDTIHLTSVRAFRRNYERLVAALMRRGVPASRIVLIGVPDMGAPPRLRQPLRAVAGLRGRRLDREVRGVARDHGAQYVDLFTGTSKQFRAHPDRYFSADNYHPSDAGYALWAKVIAPAIVAAIVGAE